MKNFVKNRLNRDNFWNVMFLGIVFTAPAIAQIMQVLYAGAILPAVAITLITSIYFFAKFNKVSFKNDVFTSNNGRIIGNLDSFKNLVSALSVILFFEIVILILLLVLSFFLQSPFIQAKKITYDIKLISGIVAFCLFIFLPIIICCIIKNHPISIIFNKNAWFILTDIANSQQPTVDNVTPEERHHSIFPHINDPQYYYLNCNIYNHNK